MANEITFTASLSFNKAGVTETAVSRSVAALLFNVTGSAYAQGTLSVATSATAIPLGGVTAPHWAYFLNQDATNFLKIRNGAAGADLLKLKPGECAFCPLYDSATPYAIADTAACLLEYLLIQL